MTNYTPFFKQHWALMQQADVYQPHPNPTFGNPEFEAASFRVLIARLSPFRDVDRSTPHLFLFQAAREALPDAYIDIACFPPQYDRRRLLKAGLPLLIGTQSWRSLADFDVVLISNAYTLELINLPYLLINSGVPILASQRDAAYPLLLLGGSNALATQAIVTATGDCVADALFFGEGERAVVALLRALHAQQAEPKRARLLHAAMQVTGLWVANGPPTQTVHKAVCPAPKLADLLTHYPLLNSDAIDTARLQITYGCPAFCSFCFEGYDRKPYREITLDDALHAAQRLKQQAGSLELDLYSFNFNTHQNVVDLILALNRQFERVSFKSQRVDVLATVPGLLEAEVIADKRNFTLGVEGISRRMRAFLHKSLADADLENVLVRLLQQKVRAIKLFYILTGHETPADLDEFRDFVRDLKFWRARVNRGVRIMFSFGLLIRMPFTPLRYDRLFLDEAEWRAIIGPVKSICETHGFEFRLATPWAEYATSQVLALGSSDLHPAVIMLAQQGHFYDRTLTPGYWEALRACLESQGHWTPEFLGEKSADYVFALDFVQQNIPADYLYKKYQEARAGVDAGYCLGATCQACGACIETAQRTTLTQHTIRPAGTAYLRELTSVMHTKRRLKPLYARLWLPPVVAGTASAWRNAWVLQQLLAQYPELADNLLAVQESLFSTKDNARRYVGMYGESIFALKAWDTAALATTLMPSTGDTAELQFLAWVDTFTPGQFRRMQIDLVLPSVHFPNAGPQLRKFLQAKYVPVNLRRVGAGYVFDIPAKARKKKVLFEGEFRQNKVNFAARLVVGPKFDVVGYLRSFDGPNYSREALVKISGLLFI